MAIFTGSEKLHLTVSFIVLTIAFALVFDYPTPSPFVMALSTVGVGFGFILHELAHRFTAIKYGYMAEYVASRTGLFITIALPLLTGGGIVFALPGAVRISHTPFTIRRVGKEMAREQLHIASAGIVTNLLLAVLFILIAILSGGNGFIGILSSFAAFINVILAGFNLIPFNPLDGAKIFTLNRKIWAILIGFALGLFFILSNLQLLTF